MVGVGVTSLSKLEAAIRDFHRDHEPSDDDPKRLRAVIDALELEFSSMARRVQQRGDHLVAGNITAASWISRICGMSVPSAADRLCVGEQLESLHMVAEAVSNGEIGYQSASVICHLRDKLGEKRECLDEEQWIGFAREHSVKDLRWLSAHTRYALDPDGFERDSEESYEERFLHISEMNGMYHLNGVIDPEAGAALKSAVDALAKRLGQDDGRTPKQRRADALTEIVYKALDEGKLPRRNGVRPHITVSTTLEGLKAELGAAASELEPDMPISSKTVQRLACDGTLCRVMKQTRWWWTWAGRRGPFRRPSAGRSKRGTAAAADRAATGPSTGRLRITSSSGLWAGRATCATSCPFATTTTASSMKAGGRWSKRAKP